VEAVGLIPPLQGGEERSTEHVATASMLALL
jgi:hypothetical protein